MAMPYPLYRADGQHNTASSSTSSFATANAYPPPSGVFNPSPPGGAPGNARPPPGAAPPSFVSSPAPSYGHDSVLKQHPPPAFGAYASGGGRTPSPTPSEAKALRSGLFDWKTLLSWRFWIRREWLWYYVAIVLIMTITALVSIYHHQIVDWLTPVTKWLHSFKFGWVVPIAILFVISFPPLFGHEIVAILCGLVWGLWIGFAIVCAGTFLGEVGNFYAFKYCCNARGEKMERTQIPYACLARCVRTGGFRIALIARFSAIPGHFTTAVFATCGMNIWVFSIAAILSLPKQFITVYLGVILEQADKGTTSTQSKIISDSVLGATFLVTLLAMWYIFHHMALAKPAVIYERRKARQAKLERTDVYGESAAAFGGSDAQVGRRASLSDIPLTASGQGQGQHPRYDWEREQRQKQYDAYVAQKQQQHQQWDAQGRAVGYAPGPAPAPVLYAPQPQHPPGRTPIEPGAYAAAYGGMSAADDGVQMRERRYTKSPPQQQKPPQTRRSLDPGTPTQAQYASYPAGNNRPTSVLPTPPFNQQTHVQEPTSPFADPEPPRSPFDDPPPKSGLHPKGHSVEPTGMSYHTAYGSDGGS
ncbi:hypothetical protein MIND_01301800 [Mycena indigotica]|uniref:Golgi apparatus membrane protein TVP38 n=1 Tax=Mycena indigotica TaxID=2126181 RepID=A0A8H6S0V0_9AGAR|nr:uncharacterized protein MIND_01301800 [Mycena indigotica]KAF7290616.1 hypothetical protein MIND_01301800 [Mycena indigotica]